MSKFIMLTGIGGNRKFRYHVDHIVQYWERDGGGSHIMLSVATDPEAVTDHAAETPEQIDALLGVTDVTLAAAPPPTQERAVFTEEEREEVTEILETTATYGLRTPRDLDVALDSIQDIFAACLATRAVHPPASPADGEVVGVSPGRVATVLENLLDALSLETGSGDTFCEVCEQHAPKSPDSIGVATGPVEHMEGCAIGDGKALLALLTAEVERIDRAALRSRPDGEGTHHG